MEDGLEKKIQDPGPDKSTLNHPTSPDDSDGGSDIDDVGLETAGKFYSVILLFLCASTKLKKQTSSFVLNVLGLSF